MLVTIRSASRRTPVTASATRQPALSPATRRSSHVHVRPQRLLWAYWLLLVGCTDEGIGDPCVPEDEYRPEFSGYSPQEVNVESRSLQCRSRVCLVNQFQGRSSCIYGQASGSGGCKTPDGMLDVSVPVEPQLEARPVDDAVYCSCRCDGEDPDAPYCDCPDGYSCADLVPYIPIADAQLAGSYCVREGTLVEADSLARTPCDRASASCGPG